MQFDLFFAVLIILLGAMIAYAIDEQYELTPRFSEWLDRVIDR